MVVFEYKEKFHNLVYVWFYDLDFLNLHKRVNVGLVTSDCSIFASQKRFFLIVKPVNIFLLISWFSQ
jgi:hypothetical protein